MITDLFTKRCSTREFLGKLGSITIRAAGSLWVAEKLIEEPKVEAATPQQVLLLSKPPAAPAASASAPFFVENFDDATTGYDNSNAHSWTAAGTAVTIKNTPSLDGTAYSILVDGSAALAKCYAAIVSHDEVYAYFQFYCSAFPGSITERQFFAFFSDLGSTLAAYLKVYNTRKVRIICAGSGADSTGTLDTGTNHIWFHYKKSTKTAEVFSSTDGVKPVGALASVTGGGTALSCACVGLWAEKDSTSGITCVFDHLRISESEIGSNPA